MSKKIKIVLITERRADYSRFKPLLEIVKKDKIVDNPLKRSSYTGVDLLSGGSVGVSASFKELSDHGVIGSPSLASKKKGTELYEIITDKVSDFIEDFSKWKKPLNGKNE